MIADTIRHAIAEKEWTISRTAREASIDRSFLSRLLSGHPPPRARDGRRDASIDPRYSKLAQALELDVDGFVAQVRKEQLLRPGREPEEYTALLSRALADIQRNYGPALNSELNMVVRQLGPAIRSAGGTMEFYNKVLDMPPLGKSRRSRGGNSSPDVIVSNHKGKDPLWEDDDLPPLCDALIELGYRCHTVAADVALDVRFDMAAVLLRLGTRDPGQIRSTLGLAG